MKTWRFAALHRKPHVPESIQPWGRLVQPHMSEILSPIIPVDWRPLTDDPVVRRRDWDGWIAAMLSTYRENLWPTWSPAGWQGAARQHMVELTYDDLEVLIALLDSHDEAIVANDPTKGIPHAILFANEDTEGVGAFFASYHERLSNTIDALAGPKAPDFKMSRWTSRFMREKLGSSTLQLKHHLQRPRAYQLAFAWGIPGFASRVATSAYTPSMISGHGHQGLVAGMGINHVILRNRRHSPGDEELASLQQYSVDIGDRRVFAGVHYPSDNIASWISLFRVADECFSDPPAAREFLVGAIGRSAVAQAVCDYVATRPGSALAGAWRLLVAESRGELSETRVRESMRQAQAARPALSASRDARNTTERR